MATHQSTGSFGSSCAPNSCQIHHLTQIAYIGAYRVYLMFGMSYYSISCSSLCNLQASIFLMCDGNFREKPKLSLNMKNHNTKFVHCGGKRLSILFVCQCQVEGIVHCGKLYKICTKHAVSCLKGVIALCNDVISPTITLSCTDFELKLFNYNPCSFSFIRLPTKWDFG